MQKTVLESIKTSKNYKDICCKTIENLVEQETPKYKKNKDIEQSVRTKLHLWAKMFFSDFNKSKKALINGENIDREFYLQVLKRHCSTAERYDFLEEFFVDILSQCKDIESIIDIGCGFNPISYICFAKNHAKKYFAYDIVGECIEFLNLCFVDLKKDYVAQVLDATCDTPKETVDVVFLFKILPLLEQQRVGRAKEIINSLNAKKFVITYPTKTVGGKNVGMYNKYSEDLKGLCEQCGAKIVFEKEYKNEIMFIIEK